MFRRMCLMLSFVVLGVLSISAQAGQAEEPLRVPGFTAYSEPEPEAMEFTQEHGVTGWTDGKQVRRPGGCLCSVQS